MAESIASDKDGLQGMICYSGYDIFDHLDYCGRPLIADGHIWELFFQLEYCMVHIPLGSTENIYEDKDEWH